jgi:hypothetical protein
MRSIEMKKKIIAISLVVCMSLNATNLNEYITSYKSSAGSWVSPTTGMKYHYGGSYEFTFKGGNKFQPWVTGSNPELKIGCNGISLKGGFVGLLGLNELKDQIKDAGQSLAWGAFISLQYAVPGLFQVFTKIREWAASIQNMLQNACNIGKALASGNPSVNKLKTTIDDYTQSEGINTTLGTGMGGFDKVKEKIDAISNCSGMATGIDPVTGESAYLKCVQANGGISKNTQNKGASEKVASAQLLNKFISPPTKPTNKLYVDKLSGSLSTGKIDTFVIANATQLAETASTLKLLRVFFGDLTIEKDSYKSVYADNTEANTGNKAFEKGVYSLDFERVKKRLEKAASDNNIPDDKIMYKLIKPVISSPESAAKALLYGISANTNDKNCGDGYCRIDDATIFFSDFGDNENRAIQIGIVGDNSSSTSDTLKLDWSGAYNESMKSIRKKVRDLTGVDPTWKTVYDGTGTIDSSNVSNVPLLVPNIERHIETIAKIEKLSKSETGLTAHLKTVLAQQNSILISRSLFTMIEGKIVDADLMGGTLEGLSAFSEHIRQVAEKVQTEIDKVDQTNKDMKLVNDLFLQIEDDLQNNKVRNF